MTNTRSVWFEENFTEYDADLRRRKGADADTPHRVTYKKLVRSWSGRLVTNEGFPNFR